MFDQSSAQRAKQLADMTAKELLDLWDNHLSGSTPSELNFLEPYFVPAIIRKMRQLARLEGAK